MTSTAPADADDMPRSFGETAPPTRLADSRVWWVLAGVAVAVLVAVMIVVAQSASAPRTPWDENGVLILARVLAGEDDVPLMLTRGYYPAASFLVAPVYWFTQDPMTVYGWANFLTNVAGIATLLPLVGIARRVGLNLPQAITASALALSLPGYTGLADYVLAEQLLGFFIVLSIYTMMRYWAAPTVWRSAAFVGSLLGALFTHPRALVGVVVATVWLAGLLLAPARRKSAAVTLAILLPAAYVTRETAEYLAALVLVDDFSQGNALGRSLSDPDVLLMIKIAFSHTWAQLVGTLGILAFGAIVVLTWAYKEIVRSRMFGPGVFILGLTLAGSLLSFINWSSLSVHHYNDEPRLDSWLYTRYISPYVLVAILIAIAALLRRLSLPMMTAAIVASGVVIAGMLLFFADTIPAWGSTYGPGNIAALRGWERFWPTEPHAIPLRPTLTSANNFWVIASLTVLAAQVITAAASRYPRFLASGLIATFGTYAYVSNPQLAREAPFNIESGVDRIEAVTGSEISLDIDIECGTNSTGRATTVNWLGYWLAPRDVDPVRPSEADFDADVIVACPTWERAGELGALVVPDSNNYGYEIWVPAGELQDRLVDAGLLARP